jgi:hypothetical protein
VVGFLPPACPAPGLLMERRALLRHGPRLLDGAPEGIMAAAAAPDGGDDRSQMVPPGQMAAATCFKRLQLTGLSTTRASIGGGRRDG